MNKPFIFDAFSEISDDYVYAFLEHEQDILNGKTNAFDKVYLPRLKAQGVNAINMAVGGERCIQAIYSNTDVHRFWDAHKKLDVLNSDLEAGCQSFVLVKTASDFEKAAAEGKIAVVATLSGGKPLEGKPNLNLLSSLRSLYRLGLRGLQLTGNTRNRLGDGVAQSCTRGKLTNFGIDVVRECNRLGILLDTAQLSDYGFYDLVENTSNPVIDSHSNAFEISNHPRNLSTDRLKAVAQTGGVVGVSLRSALVAHEKPQATLDDLMRHIDFMVETCGIDHVAIGPDFSPIKTPVDRTACIGFGNLGPEGEFDYRTPFQSEKYPGIVDGIEYGIRKNDFVEGASECETFGAVVNKLSSAGYSSEDMDKILGKNMLEVYKKVLG